MASPFGPLGVPGGVPQPDPAPGPPAARPGIGSQLLQVLPLIAAAIATRGQPAALGGLAQGLAQRRQQDEQLALEQQSLALRERQLASLEQDRQARLDASLQRLQLAQAQDARERSQQTREAILQALEADDPEVQQTLLELAQDPEGNPLPIPPQLFDVIHRQRLKGAVNTAVGKLQAQYSQQQLADLAQNPDAGVPIDPSLLRILPPEFRVNTNQIRLADLLRQSDEFIFENGEIVPATPDDAFENFLSAFAADRNTDVEGVRGNVQLLGEARRQFAETGSVGNYESQVLTSPETGEQSLWIINRQNGATQQVPLPAGMQIAGGTDRESAAASAQPFLVALRSLSSELNTTELGDIDEQSFLRTIARVATANINGMQLRMGAALGQNSTARLYLSIVSGFTPMLARAVGHTGVLTEQDVARTMELLPVLRDTAEVAQAKLALLDQMIGVGPTLSLEFPEDMSFINRLLLTEAAAQELEEEVDPLSSALDMLGIPLPSPQ